MLLCLFRLKTHTTCALCTTGDNIIGFQMQIKRPTFREQARNQEAAVQQTFHLERNSFLVLKTQHSTY